MTFLAIQWDPSLGINLGFFTLRFYSLMFVVAFSLGLFLMKKIYKNDKIPLEKLDSLFIYTVIATLLGARFGHFLFYEPQTLIEKPLEVILPFRFSPNFEFTGFRGLASHGAAIGIIIAMYLYSKRVLHKPMLYILDRVVIPVAIGGVFVRIGNFMNSEIIGKPTNSDFGVYFVQIPEGTVPRHPAQLYEAFGYIIVFIVLWYTYWKTNKKEKIGYLFGLFMVLLWTVRLIVEFFKEAQVEGRSEWALNTGQWLSIPMILVGFYFMYRKTKTALK